MLSGYHRCCSAFPTQTSHPPLEDLISNPKLTQIRTKFTNGNKTCVKNTINSEKIHTSTLKTTRSKQAPTILTSSSIHSSPYTISTRDQNFLKPRSPLFHQNKQSINQTLETKAQKTPQPADKQEPTELEQENSIEVAQITMDNNNISIHDKFLLNPLKYLENH